MHPGTNIALEFILFGVLISFGSLVLVTAQDDNYSYYNRRRWVSSCLSDCHARRSHIETVRRAAGALTIVDGFVLSLPDSQS
jgi:hypothetical protein